MTGPTRLSSPMNTRKLRCTDIMCMALLLIQVLLIAVQLDGYLVLPYPDIVVWIVVVSPTIVAFLTCVCICWPFLSRLMRMFSGLVFCISISSTVASICVLFYRVEDKTNVMSYLQVLTPFMGGHFLLILLYLIKLLRSTPSSLLPGNDSNPTGFATRVVSQLI
jgi:hypothetical protein